jgi:mannonate dehydratase
MPVTRRTLLGCAITAGLAAGGCGMPLRVFNRCATLGDPGHPVDPVLQARVWEGLDPARCWDAHVHVADIGTGASGDPEAPWVNPALRSLTNAFLLAHFALFANASCVLDDPSQADRSYVERLIMLTGEFPPGVRCLLLALDGWHDERGRWVREHTVLRVPDAYVRAVARSSPGRFEWAASIHPHRRDALVRAGYVARDDGGRIAHIQEHNPLMFDFVVKRVLRVGGRGFEAGLFETGHFFGG